MKSRQVELLVSIGQIKPHVLFVNLSLQAGIKEVSFRAGVSSPKSPPDTAQLRDPRPLSITGRGKSRVKPLLLQLTTTHLAASQALWALRLSLDAKASKANNDQVPRVVQNSSTLVEAPRTSLCVWDLDRQHLIPSGHPACP